MVALAMVAVTIGVSDGGNEQSQLVRVLAMVAADRIWRVNPML